MRLHFRPMPLFSIMSLVLLALLIWLGVWQIHRLHWKLGLIAQVNRNLTLPPISLDAALKLGKDAEYRHVALIGHFDHAKEGYAYGIANGVPVYHVLTPFITVDGRTMLVDRGIVPEELRDPAKRRAGNIEGTERVVGVWRKPDPPGSFTPDSNTAKRIWFTRNVDWVAKVDHLHFAAPALLEADATPNPGGWPKGGQTIVTFRNEHLQYAITWFGLALVLVGGYIVFHVQTGRLSWRK